MDIAKIKVSRAKALEIKEFYNAKIIEDAKRKYDFFEVYTPKVTVKAYRTKSPEAFTIVFLGGEEGSALLEASIFEKNTKAIVRTGASGFEDIGEQIGSDEVGVGDFFGPLLVTAVYFQPTDMEVLKALGVKDSKKLTDAKMLQIGDKLGKKIKHYTVMCSAGKVNAYVNKGFSTHWLLAKLHDLAQRRLQAKYRLAEDVTVYIDQFEREVIYRKYAGEKMIKNPVIFHTKGESYYPSVAIASVLARYAFLKAWAVMETKLKMTIPKGANSEVDLAYRRCVEENGRAKTDAYVKKFFKNYKRNNA